MNRITLSNSNNTNRKNFPEKEKEKKLPIYHNHDLICFNNTLIVFWIYHSYLVKQTIIYQNFIGEIEKNNILIIQINKLYFKRDYLIISYLIYKNLSLIFSLKIN